MMNYRQPTSGKKRRYNNGRMKEMKIKNLLRMKEEMEKMEESKRQDMEKVEMQKGRDGELLNKKFKN